MTIFVEADEPLLLFPSLKVAERYLEAEDVRSGVYPRAFGPEGEQYAIETDGRRVVLRPTDDPVDVDGLKQLLRRSLATVGDRFADDVTLLELVTAAEAFWEERDPMGDRFSKPVPWWGCLLIVAVIAGLFILGWRFIHAS